MEFIRDTAGAKTSFEVPLVAVLGNVHKQVCEEPSSTQRCSSTSDPTTIRGTQSNVTFDQTWEVVNVRDGDLEVESKTYLTNQHRRRFRDRHRELEIGESHSTRRRDDWLLKRKSSELNEGRAQTLRRLLTIAVVSALEMRVI